MYKEGNSGVEKGGMGYKGLPVGTYRTSVGGGKMHVWGNMHAGRPSLFAA